MKSAAPVCHARKSLPMLPMSTSCLDFGLLEPWIPFSCEVFFLLSLWFVTGDDVHIDSYLSYSSRGSVVNKFLQCERRSSCQFQMTSQGRDSWHQAWDGVFFLSHVGGVPLHSCRCCRRSHLCAWKISCLWRELWKDIRADDSGWLTRRRTNDASLRSSSVMQGAYDFTSQILMWNLDPIETSKMCHRLRSGSRLACTQWVSKTRSRWWVVRNMCRVEVFQGLWLPSPIRCCEGKNEGASWNLTCARGWQSLNLEKALPLRERERHVSW